MDQPSTQSLLPAEWDVPEEFRRRLGERAGRQRAMEADGHLLVVLHAPPAADHDDREGRFYWRDPAGLWSPTGVGPLLSEYEKAIDRLQDAEEAAKTARQYFELLNELNPLARAARNFYAALQEAREKMPDDRQLLLWRDRAYELSRSAELLHGDAKNALDFAVAERAEQEAESSRRMEVSSHRLNVLLACFFPIATLAAVLGTNLHHGLESVDAQYAPLPMLAMLAGGLMMGVLLTLFITRKP
jgi:hypothetical protein